MDKKLLTIGISFFLLIIVVTLGGILSFDPSKSHYFVNMYGETIQMWGGGVYAYDSYFMAPIFIGSDFTILVLVIPLGLFVFAKTLALQTTENLMESLSIMGIFLYYSASIAFGVTYNFFHLLYIAVFGISLFATGGLFTVLYKRCLLQKKIMPSPIPRGLNLFLFISGVALFVAWLPDIVFSLINHTSLPLIEVYTTSITNVIDMGVISPMLFLTYFLLQKNSFVGYLFLRTLLKLCQIIGLMLPVQTAFQLRAGIVIPLPVLVTKVVIFMVLAAFAFAFERQLKKGSKKTNAREG